MHSPSSIQRKKILVISNSNFISGAEQSLFDIILKTNKKYHYILAISNKFRFSKNKILCETISLPFIWFNKTLNPFRYIQFISSLLVSTFKLFTIVKKNNIQVIYANNLKAILYGVLVKYFSKKKLICHMRDNVNSRILKNTLIRKSDAIISISEHILNQFPTDLKKNYLVYGGIDADFWSNNEKNKIKIDKDIILTFSSKSTYIACIGQLTHWKNQFDFIKAAKIISDMNHNNHFLIIGDDLSGREKKYKAELIKLVEALGLQSKISFLGNSSDIKKVINQIDILVHSAIDEPFGRVIIETMALEKPVVAYNCGGPVEIIVDGKTGYLVEPNNFEQLALKTIELIENKELRNKMGEAGRQRVIEKFNIKRYIQEMEEIFDNI